ncbi:hypothetical protein SISNIDRAFT_492070 [Sistotremastrum niveocremeum HHB9708]|uniref:Uncharacterized protein n=1 Tax=Sistotremastrum niveocremeum HHB9708 TaxID=1314777 RepID=A0A164M3G8_9AGAM|nr:hypothetical protein SISNIDRAFT_492070 [Sistotremastrum niveocremeum HHB9708]
MARDGGDGQGPKGRGKHAPHDRQAAHTTHESPEEKDTTPANQPSRPDASSRKTNRGSSEARNERITQSRGSAGKPAKHGPYEISRPQPTTVPTAHPDRPAARNV